MRELQGLNAANPQYSRIGQEELQLISSPLRYRLLAWQQGLTMHPATQFAEFLLSGIGHGFRVGFERPHQLRSAPRNMSTASEHSDVVSRYVADEVKGRRTLGPLAKGSITGLHLNRLGVIPKGHTPGRWCLITDLSFPEGASVNDAVLTPVRCHG